MASFQSFAWKSNQKPSQTSTKEPPRESVEEMDVDAVILTDVSPKPTNLTTYETLYNTSRAVSSAIKDNWKTGNRYALGRCCIWQKNATESSLFMGFKDKPFTFLPQTSRENVIKEAKKIRARSLRRRQGQRTLTADALAEAFNRVAQMPFRDNASKVCIYIGEVPDGFPNANAFDSLKVFAEKGIHLYFLNTCDFVEPADEVLLNSCAAVTGGLYLVTRGKLTAEGLSQVISTCLEDAKKLYGDCIRFTPHIIDKIKLAGSDGIDIDSLVSETSNLIINVRQDASLHLVNLAPRFAQEEPAPRRPSQNTELILCHPEDESTSLTRNIQYAGIGYADAREKASSIVEGFGAQHPVGLHAALTRAYTDRVLYFSVNRIRRQFALPGDELIEHDEPNENEERPPKENDRQPRENEDSSMDYIYTGQSGQLGQRGNMQAPGGHRSIASSHEEPMMDNIQYTTEDLSRGYQPLLRPRAQPRSMPTEHTSHNSILVTEVNGRFRFYSH